MDRQSGKDILLQEVLKDAVPDPKTGVYRVTQVYVPGTEVMMAHMIGRSEFSTIQSLGLDIGCHLGEIHTGEAVGIMRFTPYEAVVIGADTAAKAANIEIGFMDRFCGSLLITGNRTDVKTALEQVIDFFDRVLHFTVCPVTER